MSMKWFFNSLCAWCNRLDIGIPSVSKNHFVTLQLIMQTLTKYEKISWTAQIRPVRSNHPSFVYTQTSSIPKLWTFAFVLIQWRTKPTWCQYVSRSSLSRHIYPAKATPLSVLAHINCKCYQNICQPIKANVEHYITCIYQKTAGHCINYNPRPLPNYLAVYLLDGSEKCLCKIML